MNASCRDLGDGTVGIWTAYEDKEAVKRLPGARWNPRLKCWTVPRLFINEAHDLVTKINRATPDTALVDTLKALFRAVPEHLRKQVYMALVRVLHPDAGGDTAAAQALTQAWREVA